MVEKSFYSSFLVHFGCIPTESQSVLFSELEKFIRNKNSKEIFIIKGYAGTGKTTTISTVVNNLWRIGKKAVLLAPTGRAAKVISGYSNKPAFTIHKKIYFPQDVPDSERPILRCLFQGGSSPC